jgi:release factor glutamine methyltransferase
VFAVGKINITNFEGVYEPAEDSWLMVNHLPEINGRVLEIGCGTGIVSIHLAHKGAQVTAVDLNPKAVEATRFNSQNNRAETEILEGDMFAPVSGRRFGTIVCNPPYLPPSDEKYGDSDLALAVEGGPDGIGFVSRLLSESSQCLEEGGSIYLIISSRMKVFDTKWKRQIIHQEKYFFERLILERFF